jgi:hypothetical protein
MIQHHCLNVCTMHSGIRQEMITISALMTARPEIRGYLLSPEILQEIKLFAAIYAEQECSHLEMPISTQKARSLKASIDSGTRYSSEVMHKELEGLAETITMELARQKFAYIPSRLDKYFEQKKLFGESVYEKCDAAKQDIEDAGNCLAASLPTASVFHLMRVAEHGLRVLAKKLRVTISHKGKACPLEFGDWNTVIAGIKNKIADARKLSASHRRQARLEAYSNAADHCEYMKDIWRNNLSHARRPYSEPEAVAVFERVRDFMISLSAT